MTYPVPILPNSGFLVPPAPTGGGVETVTATNATIVVAGTANNPTVGIGAVPATAVKHRWVVGPWRTTNLPANTTLAVPYMLAAAVNLWNVQRACKVVGFAVQMNSTGAVATPVAGSALTIRVIRVPAATGTPATGVVIGTVAIGVSNFGSNGIAMTNTVSLSAGDLFQPEVVTDGSWTATSADPGIWLELEET